MRELSNHLSQTRVREWMKVYGALCMIYGWMLYAQAPEALRSLVRRIVERTTLDLRQHLAELQTSEITQAALRGGGGMLGVAEFLVGQRGLRK
jgi:hypothetical protein